VTIQSGGLPITIHAAPGQSVQDLGREVRQVMTDVFREFGGR